MILRRSRFLHALPVAPGRVLLVHAVSHLRLSVDGEVARIVDFFGRPRRLPDDIPAFAAELGVGLEVVVGCIASLLERGFLTERAPDEELHQIAEELAPLHGRDPGEALERRRREAKSGADPAWSVASALGVDELGGGGRRLDLLLFGDCELQMECDFLRREGALRGLDLRIAATFPDDPRFAAERAHDAILIGALRAKRLFGAPTTGEAAADAAIAAYVEEARRLLSALRAATSAPILIDGLPEPTVQPLGLADRGPHGHRNRVRRLNLALGELAAEFADVHLVDVAAALGAAGAAALVDDGLVGFGHFGSPGWMLQRPDDERRAVHGLLPDTAPLAAALGGEPYAREATMARTHADVLATVIGHDRKKVVVVDLDGVLWPGVLAETGAPFAWSPEVSGAYSYVGLYFGIHEALKALKRRGLLLACVSKNDEAVVRELWTYPAHYPRERLLTLDDFVALRVNWADKADNISSIAEELGLALESFAFVDDREIERDNVRRRLPQVALFGEDLFALRRALLTDPRLQTPQVSAESAARSELVKAQLARARFQAEAGGAAAFQGDLQVERRVERLAAGAPLDRVQELFQRTTQFNATGRRFSLAELAGVVAAEDGAVFTLHVRDRFGDHGLVGSAVVEAGEITALAMSCRVIGLGAEHALVQAVVDHAVASDASLSARIVETPRNAPVRNLYRDNGFGLDADGVWRLGQQTRAVA